MEQNQDTRYGKMSQGHSPQTKEKILKKYLKKICTQKNMGFTVVPFGQGFKDMSPPTKELMKLTLEQKIAHGGHPVLRWNM